MMGRPCAAVLIVLCLPSAALAQVFLRTQTTTGVGIPRSRSSSECFIISAAHVVAAGGEVTITGDRAVQSVGSVERRYNATSAELVPADGTGTVAGDVAIVRSSSTAPCVSSPHWSAVDLPSLTTVHIRGARADGGFVQEAGFVVRASDRVLTIRPAQPTLSAGWSGSAVFDPSGKLVAVLIGLDKSGNGIAVTVPHVMSLMRTFFDPAPVGTRFVTTRTAHMRLPLTLAGSALGIAALFKEMSLRNMLQDLDSFPADGPAQTYNAQLEAAKKAQRTRNTLAVAAGAIGATAVVTWLAPSTKPRKTSGWQVKLDLRARAITATWHATPW